MSTFPLLSSCDSMDIYSFTGDLGCWLLVSSSNPFFCHSTFVLLVSWPQLQRIFLPYYISHPFSCHVLDLFLKLKFLPLKFEMQTFFFSPAPPAHLLRYSNCISYSTPSWPTIHWWQTFASLLVPLPLHWFTYLFILYCSVFWSITIILPLKNCQLTSIFWWSHLLCNTHP